MMRLLTSSGCVLGALGVGLGAFGAHALRSRVDERMLAVWETAVRYQMLHVLALLALGVVLARRASRVAVCAGWLFVAGITLFSGSLYLMVLSGQRWLGAVTPLGGVTLIAAWLLFAWTAWKAD